MIYKKGFYKSSNLSFDDELHGEFAGVKYTHHEPPQNGVIGEPLYLALKLEKLSTGKIKSSTLDFYLIGSKAANDWIDEVDARFKLNKT